MYGREIFHEKLMEPLILSSREGRIASSYIFEGAEGVGKMRAALLFADALVCQNRVSAPCGKCPACLRSRAGTHPDVVTVTSGNKKTVGVERIRELTAEVQLRPFYSQRKVYIFEDASSLTEGAQNALLKTIEEPPDYAVFIFITADKSSLLPTVRSRCVTLHFPPVESGRVVRYLREHHDEPEERLRFAAVFSGGAPERAERILSDEELERLRNESLDALSKLLSSKLVHAYDAAEFFEREKERAEQVIELWLLYLRDMLCISCDDEKAVINTDKLPRLKKAAAAVGERKLTRAIEETLLAAQMQKRYVNPRANALSLAIRIKRADMKRNRG